MATTLTTALDAVYGILHGDSTFMAFITGLFADEAPQNTLPDYGVLGFQSPGVDTLTAAGWRVLSNPVLKLVICGPQSDYANIENAYARADALLQPGGQPLRNSAGTLAIFRQAPLSLTEPELINSETWIQFGGLYRVIL